MENWPRGSWLGMMAGQGALGLSLPVCGGGATALSGHKPTQSPPTGPFLLSTTAPSPLLTNTRAADATGSGVVPTPAPTLGTVAEG